MKSLLSLFPYLKKYKYRLLIGATFIVLQNYMAIYPAILIKETFNFVEEKLAQKPVISDFFLTKFLANESMIYGLVVFSLGILVFAILKGMFTYLMRKTIIVVSRLVEFDQKNILYSHFQTLDTSFFKENTTGDIMNRLSDDVTKARMFLGPGLMYGANVLVLFLMILPVMFSISVKLTLYVLFPLPIIALLVYLVSKRMYIQSDKVQTILSQINSLAQETYSGVRIIKSYLKEKIVSKKMDKISTSYKEETIKRVQIDAFLIPLVMLLIGLSTILTVYIGGKEKITGNISLGNIAQFIYYINMLTWPVMAIGWISSLTQRAAASQARINQFLSVKPMITNQIDTQTNPNGDIEFKAVDFTYPESGIKALNQVSFKLEKGKTLGITGRTGSGKSTIINLLVRNYDSTSGEILFNQREVKKHNLFSLRGGISYVPQEVFLFSDTVANNIALGSRKKLTIEEIHQAAKRAAVFEDIMQFKDNFDANIGERGVSLSGGQKQRVSIARALVSQASILLFDDCLSAVDTEKETEIIDSLKQVGKEKTVIIISHRVSAVKNADNILVMDKGEVEESGSHEKLIASGGLYADLYIKQMIDERK